MPKFIALDGVDFAGKTTLVRKISDYLSGCGVSNIATREPGGSPAGEKVRELIIDKENELSEEASFALFVAARSDHICKVVAPAMERGEVVICDRFVASTYVYQGLCGGMDLNFVMESHRCLCKGLLPDVTLILDLEAEQVLERRAMNMLRIDNNYYDEGDIERMRQRVEGFRKVYFSSKKFCGEEVRGDLAKLKPVSLDDIPNIGLRCELLNASLSSDELFYSAMEVIAPLLGLALPSGCGRGESEMG